MGDIKKAAKLAKERQWGAREKFENSERMRDDAPIDALKRWRSEPKASWAEPKTSSGNQKGKANTQCGSGKAHIIHFNRAGKKISK